MNEQPKVFLARAGRYGEDEETALERNLAIIGFHDIPSLEGLDSYEAIYQLVEESRPDSKKRAIGNIAGQLWAFAIAMKKGDIVVLPRKLTSQVAIGRVVGPYKYQMIGKDMRHTRPVQWERTDVPRTAFEQDLLYSLGAFMTVCNISRNDAAKRFAAVLAGGKDPGPGKSVGNRELVPGSTEHDENTDLEQLAHDQIVAHIQARFAGHALATLVNAVLRADGWVTKLSPPGPDGGVDILCGRGPLGLDNPRLCVQVKSQDSPAGVNVYRTLQGVMQTFKAEQGLLVCWGGFNKTVLNEARQGHFSVRLWDSTDLVESVYRTYDSLPPRYKRICRSSGSGCSYPRKMNRDVI